MVQTWTNAGYHEFDATVRCHTSSVVTRSAATNVSTCAQSDSATTPTYITATVPPPVAVPRPSPSRGRIQRDEFEIWRQTGTTANLCMRRLPGSLY